MWTTSNGIDWIEVKSTDGFTPRSAHTAVVFDEKIWVIGGTQRFIDTLNNNAINDVTYNDVWFSTDGVQWQIAVENAPFSPRREFASAVFDNKIWIAGTSKYRNRDLIWYSSDGTKWQQLEHIGVFDPLESLDNFNLLEYENALWILPGNFYYEDLGDNFTVVSKIN